MSRFISCDWGTSRLRLRLVESESCRILAEHATDEGILHLAALHPTSDGRGEFLGAVLERGLAALLKDNNRIRDKRRCNTRRVPR